MTEGEHRLLTISTGASHATPIGKQERITWPDFVARQETPQRIPLPLQMFQNLDKDERKKLKNVGGYVFAALKDGLRSTETTLTREGATYDLDEISQDDLLKVRFALDCSGLNFLMHSTATHSAEQPKVRIIIPFDAPLTCDRSGQAYAKVAHNLAQSLGIPENDDNAFDQQSRLMYWNTVMADTEPIFEYETHADYASLGTLQTDPIETQTDPIEGELTPDKAIKTVQNYVRTESKNLQDRANYVSAKMHLVKAVMQKQIDVPTAETCVKLLACGNADWEHNNVKELHAELATADKTPPRTPGDFMEKFNYWGTTANTAVHEVQIPYTVDTPETLEEFEKRSKEKAKNDSRATARTNERPYVTYDLFLDALAALGITIKNNLIANEYEIKGLPKVYSIAGAVNTLPGYLEDFMSPLFKGVTETKIKDWINRTADIYRFNPVTDWLTNLTWDGTSRLGWIMDDILHVDTGDTLSRSLVRKWLIQCVAMAFNDQDERGEPYGADGVLTLQGDEGLGKTSFFRALTPIKKYFVSGAKIDTEKKDTLINATGAWIVELGEADSMMRKAQADLKSFITQELDSIRIPYDKAAVKRPRRASFCASVNPADYLRDTAGTRRWWTVPIVNKINFAQLQDDPKNLAQLWAEVYTLWAASPQGFRLSYAEMGELSRRNGAYQVEMPGEDELLALLDFSQPIEGWKFLSATQLKVEQWGFKATAVELGRALTKLASHDERIISKRTKAGRLWLLPTAKDGYLKEYWAPDNHRRTP